MNRFNQYKYLIEECEAQIFMLKELYDNSQDIEYMEELIRYEDICDYLYERSDREL